MLEQLKTDILVVGGGTGGTAAAIQAARCGVKTILVSEFPWLGGMLTSAGVCAPDGNELVPWQTGLWGAFLRSLQKRQPGGLDHAWVSLFTYDPQIGAEILAEWVHQLPNLSWISNQKPLEVLRQNNRMTGVRFADYLIEAKIILDGTELGDLLALGDIGYRWGWELQSQFNEPSAPSTFNELTDKYPVQSPTWVFLLKDYGQGNQAQAIPSGLNYNADSFTNAWTNYGRLPDNLFMINWPICGNDYGENLNRLIISESSQQEFLEEAYNYSLNFAHFLQSQLGDRYGLASHIFPHLPTLDFPLDAAFALHPYYRESRRLQGKTTITELDILPISQGCVAPLPRTKNGEISSIALGNYANDHHYPGFDFPLQSKSICWGGRWTGTPFTIPYEALFTDAIEGFLVCEKNISVSHIANGSTRLQPVVMNTGQAAGIIAALCIQMNCQAGELPIRTIQEALLTDSLAPSAIIPLFNLTHNHPEWLSWQRYYLDHPDEYPLDGNCPCQTQEQAKSRKQTEELTGKLYEGIFQVNSIQNYQIIVTQPSSKAGQVWQLITIDSDVDQKLKTIAQGEKITVIGCYNSSGNWLLVEQISKL